MNTKKKLGIGIATFIIAGTLVTSAFAGDSGEPGSTDDPIVTKSYVDQQITLLKEALGGTDSTTPTQPGAIAPIIVEELLAGDVLLAKAGTEVIVRSGIVTAYGDGSNGIPDVTGGLDIAIGKTIPLNHQLIFPRDDGRGVKVSSQSQGTSYVMVRGPYEVIKAK